MQPLTDEPASVTGSNASVWSLLDTLPEEELQLAQRMCLLLVRRPREHARRITPQFLSLFKSCELIR